jgi:hypothetical protein
MGRNTLESSGKRSGAYRASHPRGEMSTRNSKWWALAAPFVFCALSVPSYSCDLNPQPLPPSGGLLAENGGSDASGAAVGNSSGSSGGGGEFGSTSGGNSPGLPVVTGDAGATSAYEDASADAPTGLESATDGAAEASDVGVDAASDGSADGASGDGATGDAALDASGE